MIEPLAYHHVIDPWKLSLANRGYLIQLEILHIHDQFGFFSSGPPPRQVFEVERAMRMLFVLFLLGAAETLPVLLLHPVKNREGIDWGYMALCLGSNCAVTAFYWAIACFSRFNRPDRDWGSWEMQ
jgi:hypothetical protein